MANDTLSVQRYQLIEDPETGQLFRSLKNLGSGFTSEDIRGMLGGSLIQPFTFTGDDNTLATQEAFVNQEGTNPIFKRELASRLVLPTSGELAPQQEQGTGAVAPDDAVFADGEQVGALDPRFQEAQTAPETQAAEQGNLISFAGSPDVFDSATGQRLTEEEVLARGGFGEVEQRNQIRPGITNEEQFAQMAGQPLTQKELQALSQTGEGADQMAQESDLTAGQGADVPSQAPQAAQTGETATQGATPQLTNEDVFKEMNAQGFFDVKRRDTGERVNQKEFQEAGLNIDQISGRSQQEQGGTNFVKQMNEQGFFDVYDAKTGEKLSQEEFQAKGLNIEHIPEMQTQTEENIKRVTGQDAVDYYKTLEQTVADSLGSEELEDEVDEAQDAIRDFFDERKTATEILEEEFRDRGIEKKTTLLNDLDEQIREQKNRLKDLPDDIQNTLEDAGVTQSQLNRIITKESKQPTELLNELLEERNALASEINTAMGFAERFANTRLEDQATKLSALEFELNSAQGELTDLETEKKDIMNLALGERKSVLELALSYPSAGIDTYEDSLQEAIKKSTEVTPAQQAASEFFTDTQLAKGAANAGMSISEFGQLSADEANSFVNQPSSSGGGGTGGGGVTQTQAEQNLLNVGLSVGIMNRGGSLRKGERTEIINAGVPPSVTDFIWESITAGKSLDQIRQELTQKQEEAGSPDPREAAFGSVDLFMQTLQNEDEDSGGNISNPYGG